MNANEAVTLVVTRTSDEGCGQQLVIPDLGIRRDLPLDTPVEIMIESARANRTVPGLVQLYSTLMASALEDGHPAESRWAIDGDEVVYTVTIPAGTTARFSTQDEPEPVTLEPGVHTIRRPRPA